MISYLAVRTPVLPIKTLEDLAQRPDYQVIYHIGKYNSYRMSSNIAVYFSDIDLGVHCTLYLQLLVTKGTFRVDLFRHSTNPIMTKIWQQNILPYIDTYEGVNAIFANYAYTHA